MTINGKVSVEVGLFCFLPLWKVKGEKLCFSQGGFLGSLPDEQQIILFDSVCKRCQPTLGLLVSKQLFGAGVLGAFGFAWNKKSATKRQRQKSSRRAAAIP